MLRRQVIQFGSAAAAAASSSSSTSSTIFSFSADQDQPQQKEQQKEQQNQDTPPPPTTTILGTTGPSKQHGRSPHNYAAFGGDVGARNEAAFIDYQSLKQPRNVEEKFAMPHKVNLLTVLPIMMVCWFMAAVGWGVVLWGVYLMAVPHETISIQRPPTPPPNPK